MADDVRRTLTVDQLRTVLGLVVTVPRRWAVAIIGLAALSTLTATSRGGWSIGFDVSAITAVLVALIWLPALVRTLALTGGNVRTPAGEATTAGIADLLDRLDPGSQREALPTFIAATDVAREWARGDERAGFEERREELATRLATLTVPDSSGEKLDALAREYEHIRAAMPPGSQRTFRMTELFAEAAGLAEAVDLPTAVVTFERGSEGDRIVALALADGRLEAGYFPIVCEAIAQSRSAFEQYNALRLALHLLPVLNAAERAQLRAIVETELEDARGTRPQDDPPRWALLRDLQRALAPEKGPSSHVAFEAEVVKSLRRLFGDGVPPEVLGLPPTSRPDFLAESEDGTPLVFEVKYAGGPYGRRRIREAVVTLQRYLDLVGNARGIIVVPDDVDLSFDVPDPRIQLVPASALSHRLTRRLP